MPFRVSAAFVLGVAGAISISCGGIVDPSKNPVEPFSGTVQPGGFSTHKFSASKTGEIAIKVLTLSPVSSAFIGVQWVQASSDGNCNGGLLQDNRFATANLTAVSGQIISGNYCVVMYDPIGYTQPENYSITVSHP
jgi:hypothetical protein